MSVGSGALRTAKILLVVLRFLVVVRKRRFISCRGRHVLGVRTRTNRVTVKSILFLVSWMLTAIVISVMDRSVSSLRVKEDRNETCSIFTAASWQ